MPLDLPALRGVCVCVSVSVRERARARAREKLGTQSRWGECVMHLCVCVLYIRGDGHFMENNGVTMVCLSYLGFVCIKLQ